MDVAIVGMSSSIHVARWANLTRGRGIRLTIIPITNMEPVPELSPWVHVRDAADLERIGDSEVGLYDHSAIPPETGLSIDRAAGFSREPHPAFPGTTTVVSAHHVATALRRLEPDLVHSMEIQMAGYTVLEARRRIGASFPPWLLSNWGSDVYLFRKLAGHRPWLRAVFRHIDGYLAECARDVGIAADFGFCGAVFDPMPASGAMAVGAEQVAQNAQPPSQRRIILVKGYHGWVGRGLHILSALRMARDELHDFRVEVLFPGPSIERNLKAFAGETGMDAIAAPYLSVHADAMKRLAASRMVVGLGISDGISQTLLEAMSVGTFPILADTSCACEWIENGRHGMIVPPHDVAALAAAISRAASDDELVDTAAQRNMVEIRRRWSAEDNAAVVEAMYARMIRDVDARPFYWKRSA